MTCLNNEQACALTNLGNEIIYTKIQTAPYTAHSKSFQLRGLECPPILAKITLWARNKYWIIARKNDGPPCLRDGSRGEGESCPPQEILEKIMNRKERKEKRIGGRRKGKEKKGRRKEKGRKKGRGWEGGRTYLVHDGKSHPHSKKREREFR